MAKIVGIGRIESEGGFHAIDSVEDICASDGTKRASWAAWGPSRASHSCHRVYQIIEVDEEILRYSKTDSAGRN